MNVHRSNLQAHPTSREDWQDYQQSSPSSWRQDVLHCCAGMTGRGYAARFWKACLHLQQNLIESGCVRLWLH